MHRYCPIVTKFGLCRHSSVERPSVKRRNIHYCLWTEGRTEKGTERYANNSSVYSCVASMPVNGSQIDVYICIFVCLLTYISVRVVMCLFTQCGPKVLRRIFLKKFEDT